MRQDHTCSTSSASAASSFDVPTSLETVAHLRQALERTDGHDDPDTYLATVTALGLALFVGCGRPADLEAILRCLTRGPSGRRGTLLHAFTLRLRGLILVRFGAVRSAVRLLERAYRELGRLEQPIPTVQTALDLGILYGDLRHWRAMRRVATDAVFLFRDDLPLDAHAAVLLWRDTVLHGDVDDAVVARTRSALAECPAGEVGIPPTPPPVEPAV